MTISNLSTYLGIGLVYAVFLAAVIFGLFTLLIRRPSFQETVTIYVSCFFISLTQHPFPDPATLDCSGGGVQPILNPFNFWSRFSLYWEEGAPIRRWLQDKVVLSTGFNFVLCAVIGFFLARHLRSPRPYLVALGLGVLLSGSAEIMQLTGMFGLFPCPYRHFETTDLITNIGGVLSGLAAGRFMLQGRSPSPRHG